MSTNLLTFGGNGGNNINYFPTDLGGQFIGCNAGSVIDQIWVTSGGEKITYGGGGGGPAGSVQLPANGLVHLKEIDFGNHNGDQVVSYLIFGVPDSSGEEQTITFGTSSANKNSCCIITPANLWVKFYGVHYGSYVDQLIFELADSN